MLHARLYWGTINGMQHIESVRLLQAPSRLPCWALMVLLLSVVLGATLAAVVGAQRHPRSLPPAGDAAERRIAAVFSVPKGASDVLRGDYLVERFYALDRETGEVYVADMLKGRVTQALETTRQDYTGSYTLLLERSSLKDRSEYVQNLLKVAAPIKDADAKYLGVKLQDGPTEAFNLNYTGALPRRLSEFTGPRGEDIRTFLKQQPCQDCDRAARVINIQGTNYLLSNTDIYGYLQQLFPLKRATFLSQLIIVAASRHWEP